MTRTCAHHWLIETPNGSTSRGRCRSCGAERDFTNWSAKAPVRILSASERAAVTRAKRTDAIMNDVIRHLGQDGYLPLNAYRRNLRDHDDGE